MNTVLLNPEQRYTHVTVIWCVEWT